MNFERPNGSTATAIGWLLIVVGVFAIVVGANTETMDAWVLAIVIANLGFGLGVLLLSLGYLVRAIWFLPGREIDPNSLENNKIADNECNWCGQNVALPNQPCANIDPERLQEFIPQITNVKCVAALEKNGLLDSAAVTK